MDLVYDAVIGVRKDIYLATYTLCCKWPLWFFISVCNGRETECYF